MAIEMKDPALPAPFYGWGLGLSGGSEAAEASHPPGQQMGRFDECHMGMILAQPFGSRVGIIATMGRPKDQKPVVLRGKSHCGEACSHPMDRSYPPGIGGLAPAEEGPAGLQGDQTVIRRVDEDGGRGDRDIWIRTEADRKPTDTRGRGDEDKGGGRLELRGKGSTHAGTHNDIRMKGIDRPLRDFKGLAQP